MFSDPVTNVFATTTRDHPIHLWDATTGQVLLLLCLSFLCLNRLTHRKMKNPNNQHQPCAESFKKMLDLDIQYSSLFLS